MDFCTIYSSPGWFLINAPVRLQMKIKDFSPFFDIKISFIEIHMFMN